MFGPRFAGFAALLMGLATAQTTTLEAESATLSGVTVATTVPGYSGEHALFRHILLASTLLISKQDLDMSMASTRQRTRSHFLLQRRSQNSSTYN
jgi:hypothetical protein